MLSDVKRGYISTEMASENYSVKIVIEDGIYRVDHEATEQLRQ